MSDPLMTLLINHDVFPLAPNKRDVLYSALKAYVDTRVKETNQRDEAVWKYLNPPIAIKNDRIHSA